MKPLALNLSKMKKVEGDDKSSTFLHPDGHKMVIAHSGISALQRKQIEGMPVQKLFEGTPDGPLQIEPVNNSPLEVEPVQSSAPAQPETTDVNRAPAGAPQYQDPMRAQYSAFQEEKSANTARAKAIGQMGNAEAQAEGDTADQIANLPTQSDIVNSNKAKNDELFKAYSNQKLDPEKYWEHHSKWGAALGMALSGMGSATTGQANGAMQVINDGINRNIDAQKNAQDQKMNLWKMNRDALGSDLAANLATQNQLYVGLQHKLAQAAAQSKSPIEAANARITNAKIDQEMFWNNQKLGYLANTSDDQDPEIKLQQGIRLGIIPPAEAVKIAEEIKNRRDIVAIKPQADAAFEQAAKDARPMTGGIHGTSPSVLNPLRDTPGQNKYVGLVGTTVKEQEGTARQAAFKAIHDYQVPNTFDSDSAVETKRQTKDGYFASHAAAPLSKTYGIDLDKYPATRLIPPKVAPPEQAKPQLSKSGRPMIQRNGKWYYQ